MKPLQNRLTQLGYEPTILDGHLGINTVFGMPEKIVNIAEELKERHGSVSVVGHSWGGRSAVEAAKERPDLFEHVIAYGSPICDLDGPGNITAIGSTGDTIVPFPVARGRGEIVNRTIFHVPHVLVHTGLLNSKRGFAAISERLAL